MKPESRKNSVEVEIHMTVSLEAKNLKKNHLDSIINTVYSSQIQ